MTGAVRIMYDSVTPADIPLRPHPGAQLVAGYVDGQYRNAAKIHARFPHLPLVTITTTGKGDAAGGANVCDRETGDATARGAALWAKHQLGAGAYPTIYCNRSSWADCVEAVRAAGLDPARVGWWIADWTGRAHPLKLGKLTALAVQYAAPPGSGGHYDLSAVYGYWPEVDPAPSRPLSRRHRRFARILTRAWHHRGRPVPAADVERLTALRKSIDRVLGLD